jgi:hypothetical protein
MSVLLIGCRKLGDKALCCCNVECDILEWKRRKVESEVTAEHDDYIPTQEFHCGYTIVYQLIVLLLR